MRSRTIRIYTGLVALLLANLLFGLQPVSPADAQSVPQWQDTGRTLPTDNFCVDSGHKDQLLYVEAGIGENPSKFSLLNLQTGENTLFTTLKHADFICAPKGNFYIRQGLNAQNAYLISSIQPSLAKIDYMPTHIAVDGSRYTYYFERFTRVNNTKSLLKVSSDGGLTWQERGQQFNGYIRSFTMAQSDARVVYALVQGATPQADGNTPLSIYVSRDAGTSWELRYQDTVPDDSLQEGIPYVLSSFSNYHTPTTFVKLIQTGRGTSSRTTQFVSVDGAKTFNEFGKTTLATSIQLESTANGLLRYRSSNEGGKRIVSLDYSDNAKDWSPLTLPEEVISGSTFSFQVIPASPNTFLLTRTDLKKVWLSPDGGKSWRVVSEGFSANLLYTTPYAPTALIGVNADKRVFKLDLSQYDRIQTERARANNLSADNIYFPETGHNLNGVFRRYWEAKGGLAQFGYPKTEPFPEYNPADGKIYTVQYYERNRFEYHPELAGTKYEVLLGLLGNQMTEKQRAQGHGAFNRFPNMNYPGGTYFPETGHNLRNSFKAYWEQYGGLAIYGYPTSEEYEEVNPDDGKTYVVQYFERARFEYHPENKGTKYEVLLGLLGNALLRQKAWLS
jgi:hypothetical protein